ncbi:MAG: AI-2E family transporter [candidate division KSB1 bacterium]|nr:AI-2E family transporter [candidate division KSB1 bacterium]
MAALNQPEFPIGGEKALTRSQARSARHEFLALVVGLVLIAVGAALYRLRESISPALLALAAWVLLYPYRRVQGVRLALWAISLVFCVQLVVVLKTVLFPFVLSLGLAYLLDPLVGILARRGLPRTLTILLLDALALGAIVAVVALLIPKLLAEVGSLVEQMVSQAPALQEWYTNQVGPYLSRFGLDSSRLVQELIGSLPQRSQGLLRVLFNGLVSAGTGLSNLLGQLLTLVLVPFVTFYLLRDFEKVRQGTKELLVPARHRPAAVAIYRRIDRVVSGFVRGQLLVCLLVGSLTALGLFVAGIRYSLALGILAGVLNLVPYVGITVTLIVAVLIGLFDPYPWSTVLKTILVIEGVQIVESTVLSPRIVGNRVGLHPVWVMLAVIVFSRLMGVVGLFVAVPVAAVLKELALDYLRARQVEGSDAGGT